MVCTWIAHNGAVKFLFAYDARGHLASVTGADWNIITVQRDAQGKLLAIVAPDGQKTTLTLDANGYLASIAYPKIPATPSATSLSSVNWI